MAYPGAQSGLHEPADRKVMAAANRARPLPAKLESGNHDCLSSSKGSSA